MAKFLNKYGEIRGKIADLVFSVNKAGAYIRAKVTPLNPSTELQQAVRAQLAQASQAYSNDLTEVQREGWRDLARREPYTNIFGEQRVLPSISLFVKCYANNQNIGEDVLLDAPYNLAVRPVNSCVVTLDSKADRRLKVEFTPDCSADEHLLVYATPAIRPSISFVKNLYRLATASPAAQASGWLPILPTTLGPLTTGNVVHGLVVRGDGTKGAQSLGAPFSIVIP